MKIFTLKHIIYTWICLLSCTVLAQDSFKNKEPIPIQVNRIEALQIQLDTLAKSQPGLNAQMNFNFSQLNIQELFREMGRRSKVNIDVNPNVKYKIVNNFSNVTVKEILVYLCKQYQLDIDITGTILYVFKHKKVVVKKPKTFIVDYKNEVLTLDFKNDTLAYVSKAITNATNKNIILKPEIQHQKVNLYVKGLTFQSAIDKLALANGLEVEELEDGTVVLSKKAATIANNGRNHQKSNSRSSKKKNNKINITRDAVDSTLINLEAKEVKLEDVIIDLFEEVGASFFIYSKIEGDINVRLERQTIESILEYVSTNTKYYFTQLDVNSYSYGERLVEGVRLNEVIPIKYRDVVGILDHFPSNILKDIEVKEHADLNSLIVSGSQKNINEITDFLMQIDKPIPVILIDVIVVDYTKNNSLEAGVRFGNGEEPAISGGTMFPDAKYTFSANSINKILNSFDRFGALNLGGVNPNFFVSLKALESNGIIDVKSTPKLSALNGQEATFTNGSEEFYLVEQTNAIGTQNPQLETTRNWKSIKASLDIKITPSVSLNGEVTLMVAFSQTSFTGRIAPTAPPGVADRSLTSTVRVRDGDMILLGGLEQITKNDSGTGVPLLSRIPIIKWFFSSRNKTKNDSKLHVFIKPTVLY